MPPFQPFNYGNVLSQGENILNARAQRDPNSPNNRLREAQIQALETKAQNPGGLPTYAKQPFFVKGKDGRIQAYQLSDQGGAIPIDLPDGAIPALKGSWRDTGGEISYFDPYGRDPATTVGQIDLSVPSTEMTGGNLGGQRPSVEKTIPPEKTPEAQAAAAAARQQAIADVDLQAKPQQAKAETLAKADADAIVKAQNQVGVMLNENQKLDKVIAKVEAGANTGLLMNYLPSLRAETIALEQLQKEMGLDVVGSVTFGALSKGELDLALQKALPTNMKGPDLVKWARDKQAANRKLLTYMQEQVGYLRGGGNIAGWQDKINQAGGINEYNQAPGVDTGGPKVIKFGDLKQ